MRGKLDPIAWWDADPARFAWELDNMDAAAPDLVWDHQLGGWIGHAPIWPFPRPASPGLETFTAGKRLHLALVPTSAHPATPPKAWPLDPEPTIDQCTRHRWHVNGDGSLCLFQRAVDWTGEEPCAEIAVKASGWFLEYLLVERGCVEAMTENGIVIDQVRDPVFESCPPANHRSQ